MRQRCATLAETGGATIATQYCESRIVIPTRRNPGGSIATDEEYAARGEAIEKVILSYFKGFTLTTGYGSWVDPEGEQIEEPVHVYTVSYAVTGKTAWHLEEIRGCIFAMLEQQAAYISTVILREDPIREVK